MTEQLNDRRHSHRMSEGRAAGWQRLEPESGRGQIHRLAEGRAASHNRMIVSAGSKNRRIIDRLDFKSVEKGAFIPEAPRGCLFFVIFTLICIVYCKLGSSNF